MNRNELHSLCYCIILCAHLIKNLQMKTSAWQKRDTQKTKTECRIMNKKWMREKRERSPPHLHWFLPRKTRHVHAEGKATTGEGGYNVRSTGTQYKERARYFNLYKENNNDIQEKFHLNISYLPKMTATDMWRQRCPIQVLIYPSEERRSSTSGSWSPSLPGSGVLNYD